MIKHRYAKGVDDSIVDVFELEPEKRREFAPYTCFGCGGDLVPNLGKKKIKHYSHNVPDACSKETYLHNLAKNAFYNKYVECLSEEQPFYFEITRPAICNHFQEQLGKPCKTTHVEDYDLTSRFKSIKLETAYDKFVPDILLSTEDGRQVIFVEIAVTHKCEDEKIRFGERIIEMDISSESDILPILKARLSENSQGITTHNLKKKEKSGDICGGRCEKEVGEFLVFDSQKSILLKHTAGRIFNAKKGSKAIHRELILDMNLKDEFELYKRKVREAHFGGIPIRSCYLCRYHGSGLLDNQVFCKFKKESVSSNEAVGCDIYRTFNSMVECRAADVSSEEYAKKNKFSMPFGSIIGRFIDRRSC